MKKAFLIVVMMPLSVMAQAQGLNLCPDDNHPHMIDLGLSDGSLWACCNVGAETPEESGDYFAWGETSPKENYSWESYKWCDGSMYNLKKYNYDIGFGIVDNKLELDLEDDAAYVNWGSKWIMPNERQISCLRGGTTPERTTINGVNGVLLKSRNNNNSIFIPDTGSMFYSDCYLDETQNYFGLWTRTLDPDVEDQNPYDAAKCPPFDSHFLMCYYERFKGYPVRPVVLTPAQSGIVLNTGSFPDNNFRQALSERYNISNDGTGEITPEQIASTTMLMVSHKSISNMSGVELFPFMNYLYCDNNLLTSLDVSNNTNLYRIDCSHNLLQELIIPPSQLLHMIFIHGNKIKGNFMDAIINNLPRCPGNGTIYVIDSQYAGEENECTKAQVNVAKNKGWNVGDFNGGNYIYHYEGSETEGIEEILTEGEKDRTYYSLDGRRHDGKPMSQGVYIINGHKIVIK